MFRAISSSVLRIARLPPALPRICLNLSCSQCGPRASNRQERSFAVRLQKISKRWPGFCVVAATGPSLTKEIADRCAGFPVVAVNDAYRLFPNAAVLYACDERWWRHHNGAPDFKGECWSSHGNLSSNNKLAAAEKWRLRLVRGRDEEGFSQDPAFIHYGMNSGYQALNMALHLIGWRGRILLLGFDMTIIDGQRHFFGDHPPHIQRNTKYEPWIRAFNRAAAQLPEGVEILNGSKRSALECFRKVDIDHAFAAAA